MKKYPKISIIIALYKETAYFYETVAQSLQLDYPNFEILIGVDRGVKLNFKDPKIKVWETGLSRTGPAEKRDIGIIKSKSEYIAFLDDDSYPKRDWLKKAVDVFNKNPEIAAVGGPGLTPPLDGFRQQITGAILSTFWGTGPYAYRFVQKSQRLVDDYPAYNLIVGRKDLLSIGGFNNKFYGGEDTALCLKLINAGKKILYSPDIVVYHHRRHFPEGYLAQVGNVGLHRGYFVKRYPETSLRPSYFMPLFGIISTLLLILLSISFPSLIWFGFLLYVIGIVDALRITSFKIAIILPICIYLSHLSYAYNFTKGLLFTKHLEK